MKQKLTLLGAGLVFFLASQGNAQITTGTVSGVVSDSTGAVLPGASVVILNEDTGISRTVTTDAAGRYLAPSLNLGRYRTTASQEGFQKEVRSGIVLTVGREAVVNFQLSVGAITQTVEVTGEAPLVQAKESTVSYLVDDRTIHDLPLNGRDLTQLILLNPGVSQAENSGGQTGFQGFGKRLSVGGFRGEDNAFLLDGSYINDFSRHIPQGPGGALFGAETVREFQVLTNSYSAQYGRALGGVFNAVSKSGNNEWHGGVYEFLRNSALDARDFFDRKAKPDDPRLPPFRRNQFGATLGGPVARDKSFFFLAYEGLRESLATTNYNVVPDLNARRGILPRRPQVEVSSKIAPYLPLFPLPSPQGKNFDDGTAQYIFVAHQPTRDEFGQGRLDYNFSENRSLFIRITASNADRSIVNNYPGFTHTEILNARLATISETRILTPSSLNTIRFSFNRVAPADGGTFPEIAPELLFVPGQPPGELSPGSGINSWGGFGTIGHHITNRFNFQDDVNLTLGGHSLQFGGMIERLQFNQDLPNRPFGSWGFVNLDAFLQAIPNSYRGTPPQFGISVRGFRHWFFALYVQDDWRATRRLTLNLGLRWEPYTVPTEVNGRVQNLRHLMDAAPIVGEPYWLNKSRGDLGPRFGFAWSPFENETTSLRGGFGLFYVPNDPSIFFIQTARMAPLQPEFQIPALQPSYFPNALAEILNSPTPFGTANALDFENLKTPRAIQYNLNVQQQLGSATVLALGFAGGRGINLSSVGNYNMPLAQFNGIALEIPQGATTFNPTFAQIRYNASNVNSWYNGVSLSVQRRFSAGLQVRASYTFSKTLSESDQSGTASNVTTNDSGTLKYPHDLRVSKGPSGYSVPHLLSIDYSYELPFRYAGGGWVSHLLSGWQVTGIITAKDGQPFGISAGVPTPLTRLGVVGRSPNLVAGKKYDQVVLGGPDQYFDRSAFSPPGARELGNVGRNPLLGPGLVKWDFGLTKNAQLTEQWRLEFRTEVFNSLNRPNFANPASQVFTGTGGAVNSAGVITSTIPSSRQIQFALKLIF